MIISTAGVNYNQLISDTVIANYRYSSNRQILRLSVAVRPWLRLYLFVLVYRISFYLRIQCNTCMLSFLSTSLSAYCCTPATHIPSSNSNLSVRIKSTFFRRQYVWSINIFLARRQLMQKCIHNNSINCGVLSFVIRYNRVLNRALSS